MCSDVSGAGDSECAVANKARDTPCQGSIACVSTMLQGLRSAVFDAVDSTHGNLETKSGAGTELISG